MQKLMELATHNSLAALGMAFLVAGIARAWKCPPVAHALWLLVLFRLVAPPILLLNVSGLIPWRLGAAETANDQADITSRITHQKLENDRAVDPTEGSKSWISSVNRSVMGFESSRLRIASIVAAIWLTGVVVYVVIAMRRIGGFNAELAGMAPASQRVQRLCGDLSRQLGIAASPDVVMSGSLAVPFAWCVGRRKTIVLPIEICSQVNDVELEMILTHELAHVRRRDHWTRIFEMMVSAIYWWNPTVHLIKRNLHFAEDLCCDAWVRRRFPGSFRQYCELLLTIAESVPGRLRHPGILPANPLFRDTLLTERIKMNLENRSASVPALKFWPAILLATLVATPVIVPWAEERAAAEAATSNSEFPYQIPFEQGATEFEVGDRITITEVRGTAETFAAGNIYWIKGRYTLATKQKAQLATFVTAAAAKDGTSSVWKVQSTIIDKGDGTFTLFLPMSCRGWPHVSFYPERGGESFGGIYFGTGDSVLKQQ